MAEDFDIYQFEDRVSELIGSYRALAREHADLTQSYDALLQRHENIRGRLQSVVERIAALEAEAEALEI